MSGSQQESMDLDVGFQLDGYTWQFDTNRLARVLSPKMRKFPLKPGQVDNLDAYIDNTIPNEVLQNAMTFFGMPPTFPNSKAESDHYEPLCKLLNNCVEACHKALRDSKGEYYRDLKFVKWDNPTQDGYSDGPYIKPNLAGGINLPEREEIKAKGGLYWRRPCSNEHELLLPVEIKKGWKDLVCQAGLYARCLFMASPLRKFALVLGYEYDSQEIRILVFHHGGLTSSKSLKLNANGTEDLLHMLLAILSWKTVVDAGLPLWCNDSNMILPGEKGPQVVQLKKVLHDTFTLRGRCARVILVDESDKRDGSKSNLTIPAPESICAPDRLALLPITITQENGYTIENVTQNIIEFSSNLNFASPGMVVKCSWVSPAAESIESDLLRDCSGLFGTPKHYYSFLASHGNGSPATNHLFLPDDTEIESCYWNLFRPDARSVDRRSLYVFISSFAGHSLETARSPKMLIHAVLHACLGWFNLIQKGYLHRDISIGNVAMMEDAVTTKAFGILKEEGWNATVEGMTEELQKLKIDSSAKATWENKLIASLHDLGVTDKCHGFVIDGDMAINMVDYFNEEHPGSRWGTYEFMSDGLLDAARYCCDYLQSPVDDLYSFYHTLQWAAVFHNQEFADKDIPVPPHLKGLRENLSGNRRTYTTFEITALLPLTPHKYGSVLANCQPMLRAWHLELQRLQIDWMDCELELEGQETKAEIYIALFTTFAVRGVAALAELVHIYTKDMD